MSRPERQQNVLDLLKELRGIEPLKQLFWSELNYQRVNQPLSRRGWTESAGKALADDPVLFAGGGDDGAFHVIYCRLASDGLPRGLERPAVTQLLREHPYALFVFSNRAQTDWHFLNVKFDEKTEHRRLFRRISVKPGLGLRTATERIQLLDLTEIHPELFGITPLAIQQRCDRAFDVETVTKDFFREIANWYFWALEIARFPKYAPKEADGHDHISIIRLITRLIFCWFVKEKGLIPDELFDDKKLSQLLNGFAPDELSKKESVFYKAILQNLFFATLNTEMNTTEKPDSRKFRGRSKQPNGRDQHHLILNVYRYEDAFRDSRQALKIFSTIPFLNGGLFECLDKSHEERMDGFSDHPDNLLTVPDFLFFGAEMEGEDAGLDWEEIYGRRPENTKIRGLIHTFKRYNFTVEEDTPIDQEVALDPELSGKVFENLLAAYNPETGATARKQTGWFYTPREIVNYMVEEALIACLKEKLTAKIAKDTKTDEVSSFALSAFSAVEHKLRHLFAYNDEPHQFTPAEVDALIAAIDNLKSLDRAVGSGAFPMGILHKLVFILGKLDPRNEKWKVRQIQRVRNTIAEAEKIEDAPLRERTVRDLEQQIAGINEAFEHNELDYGRKLYLIENCIYGVDIQPIAVQIAKMRFFISLIVDQKIDDTQPNRGVCPLPNLETKFVAANTLIGVNRPGQQLLRNREIDAKEAELRRVRERHFLARTLTQKRKCREQDEKLRAEIAELLKGDGWDTATARKLASWNPYDQNASADFFDAEWMFGILNGFDALIANPPYGANIDTIISVLRPRYQDVIQNYAESFKMFFQLGLELASSKGVLTYISPNVFLSQPRYKDLRKYLLRYRIMRLVNLGENVFEQVVSVCLSFITNECPGAAYQFADLTDSNKFKGDFTSVHFNEVSTARVASFKDFSLYQADALKAGQVYFDDALEIKDAGIQYHRSGIGLKNKGGNDLYERLFSPSQKQFLRCKPVWYGRLIDRYWMDGRTDEFFNLDYERILKDNESVSFTRDAFAAAPKILWRQTASRLQATIDFENHWFRNTIQCAYLKKDYQSQIDLHYLLGVVNSKYIAFAYNKLVREAGRVFPQVKITHVKKLPLAIPPRKQQEEIAKKVKAVLGTKCRNQTADTSALEWEIDQQVYALYGLTPEEIKIVEEASK